MLAKGLKKGDYIGVIAPSDPIEEKNMEDIDKSVKLMENAGYHVVFGKNVKSNKTGYGATAKEKADDICQMFKDNKVKAIFCAKGGYNSNSVFDKLDYELIKNNPKIICGFSDSTSILNIIYEKTGLITFHGPTFKSLVSWDTLYAFESFIERMEKHNLSLAKEDDEFITINEGVAEGVLIGGNLNLFTNLIDGKYKVNTENKILFLEDLGVESPPGMISNFFYRLKQNNVFDKINGIWLGNYEHESGVTIEQILLDVLEGKVNFPIIKSNNFGHTDRKVVIPIGTKAKIDTSKKVKIMLQENCVL